jgi:hypothetical protein
VLPTPTRTTVVAAADIIKISLIIREINSSRTISNSVINNNQLMDLRHSSLKTQTNSSSKTIKAIVSSSIKEIIAETINVELVVIEVVTIMTEVQIVEHTAAVEEVTTTIKVVIKECHTKTINNINRVLHRYIWDNLCLCLIPSSLLLLRLCQCNKYNLRVSKSLFPVLT